MPAPVSIMTTPGASATSEEAARVGSGSAASMARVTTCPTDAPCDSIAGTEALTVTASCRPSISRVTSRVTVWSIATVTARRCAG